MTEFDILRSSTSDVSSLDHYIKNSLNKISNEFNSLPFSVLKSKGIPKYIKINRNTIFKLIPNKINLSFICLLLDTSERLNDTSSFNILFDFLQEHKYEIGIRLNAVSKYLKIKDFYSYLNIIGEIINDLQQSFDVEQEANLSIITLMHFYALVVCNFRQFNINGVNKFREKILSSIQKPELSFLFKNPLANQILSIDINNPNIFLLIYDAIDKFTGREHSKSTHTHNTTEFLIESNTEYSNLIKSTQKTFENIRRISVKAYSAIADDRIFNSLHRGVAILEEENQLYAYMNSYSTMHYEKLITCFSSLPTSLYDHSIIVYDWGCGQGLATMALIDFARRTQSKIQIDQVTLIEPSMVALKRAALHIQEMTNCDNIATINKDLDSFLSGQVRKSNSVKIHLFSNILDIELFSVSRLAEFIDQQFSGDNYFICASPFINDMKSSRINGFVSYFAQKQSFVEYLSLDSKSGNWTKQWSRILRVFKISI